MNHTVDVTINEDQKEGQKKKKNNKGYIQAHADWLSRFLQNLLLQIFAIGTAAAINP